MEMEAKEKKYVDTEEKGREEVVWKTATASITMNLASGNTTIQKEAEEKIDAATEEEGREEVDQEAEKEIDVNGIIHVP